MATNIAGNAKVAVKNVISPSHKEKIKILQKGILDKFFRIFFYASEGSFSLK